MKRERSIVPRVWARIAFVALIATLGATSNARADDAPAVAAKRVVDVVIIGPADDAAAIEGSLRELLRRLGLEMRVSRADRVPDEADRGAPAPDVAVRVWIDVRAADVAHVEIVDARGVRPSVKRDVAREGTRSILVEDVAHVVQAATESILSISPAPPPPPPRPPKQDAAPPPRREEAAAAPRANWSFDLATFASATPYARDNGVVLGAGAGARVGFAGDAWHPALWITGAYHAPFGHEGSPLELRTTVWSVRVMPAARVVDAGRFSFDFGAGGGADFFVLSPGAAPQGATVDAGRTEVSPILGAIFVARFALTASASAFLGATIDWDLKPRRYVVVTGDARDAIVSPLVVRPGLTLGLSFDLVGSWRAP